MWLSIYFTYFQTNDVENIMNEAGEEHQVLICV